MLFISPARAELLAHGSSEMYWIARSEQGDAGQPRTFIQARRLYGEGTWRPVAQITSTIASLADSGTQLAVLLDNGDWMLVWQGGSSSGPLPEDGSKLLALASGPDTLWAIASAGAGRTPTTRGATQPAASLPAGTLLLYRLERGQWALLAPLPGIVADAQHLSVAQSDGSLLLARLSPGGRVVVFAWSDDQEAWQSRGEVDAGAAVARIKLLGGLDRPALWAGGPSGAGALFVHDGGWSGPVPLAMPPDVSAADVAVAGNSIRVLAAGEKKITEYSFAIDGTSRGESDLPLPTAPVTERQFEWLSAVTAGILMVVLLSSMRRRGVVPPEALQAAGVQLAPNGLRLLAGIIDALPVIVTLVVISARMDNSASQDLEQLSAAMLYPYYIAAAVYVLHTLLSELRWGRTIGKKLCGLRVAMIDGSRARPRAIVVRNLLRVVDVAMIFPPLMVLITPLRQRVGDLAAETVVVVAAPQPPPQDSA